MWKSCATVTLDDVSLPNPFAMIQGGVSMKLPWLGESGLEGLEVMTLGNADNGALADQFERYGLQVHAVSTGSVRQCLGTTVFQSLRMGGTEIFEVLDRMVDAAEALHAPVLTLGGVRGNPEASDELLDFGQWLLRFSERAAYRGVLVAIEPLNRYECDVLQNVEETCGFLEALDAPSVGLVLDFFHMNIEEASIPSSLGFCYGRKRLFHVHIADSNRLLPGYGHLDICSGLRCLKSLGYDGAVSGELKIGDVEEHEAVMRYVQALDSCRDGSVY
jgi:sugar phosphate isomerase/epimerase